jgi:hypothetical protein
MSIPQRIIIHPRDIANLTGCGERNARKILQKIRAHQGKMPRDYISITEFCYYTGIDEDVVRSCVNNTSFSSKQH